MADYTAKVNLITKVLDLVQFGGSRLTSASDGRRMCPLWLRVVART